MAVLLNTIKSGLLLFSLLVVSLLQQSLANNCSGVFTSGVTSHSASGQLNFVDYARVIDSGTVLDIGIGNGTWSRDCNTGACVSSGNIGDEISLPSFNRSSSSSSVSFRSNWGAQSGVQGDYDQVTIGMNTQVTINANGGLTRINNLTVGMNARLILAEGDYWISSLDMAANTQLYPLNNGKIRLFVENYSESGNNVKLNEYRSPENFIMVSYSDLEFNKNTNSSGFFM
ncbi:hypothetical protein [Glaciecola sp. KUL10]|uniref:hypothetical protein n=1 Tax=Glaciecola sp. (strain KUL10) TaxID=2161813 RepID=UPI000D787274|nr:hypothetical protein [Glaciecola sp. KUL10]GBL03642.1 thrombospondin type 3 repeat family [Glaciecola sp. KUL10]